MKRSNYILAILFFSTIQIAYSQSMGAFWKYNKYLIKERVIIRSNDTTIEAEVASIYKKKRPHIDKRYYWYKQQAIKITQGGYDGRLLHGSYKKLDQNNNLIEKGTFRYGLKNKKWVHWKSNGDLDTLIVWRRGIIKRKKERILNKATKLFSKVFPKSKKEDAIKKKALKLQQTKENKDSMIFFEKKGASSPKNQPGK